MEFLDFLREAKQYDLQTEQLLSVWESQARVTFITGAVRIMELDNQRSVKTGTRCDLENVHLNLPLPYQEVVDFRLEQEARGTTRSALNPIVELMKEELTKQTKDITEQIHKMVNENTKRLLEIQSGLVKENGERLLEIQSGLVNLVKTNDDHQRRLSESDQRFQEILVNLTSFCQEKFETIERNVDTILDEYSGRMSHTADDLHEILAQVKSLLVKCEEEQKPRQQELNLTFRTATQQLSQTDGEIQLSQTDGEIQLSQTDGEIQLSQTDGEIQLSQTGGEIQLSQTDGEIQLSQTDGEIQLSQTDGDIQLSQTDGEIQQHFQMMTLEKKLVDQEMCSVKNDAKRHINRIKSSSSVNAVQHQIDDVGSKQENCFFAKTEFRQCLTIGSSQNDRMSHVIAEPDLSVVVSGTGQSGVLIEVFSPGPVSPGPVSPGPVSPGPVSPGPLSPGPVSPGPVSPGPVSPGPVSPGPLSPGPVSPSPTTHIPVSPGPVSPGPVTHSPISPGLVDPGQTQENAEQPETPSLPTTDENMFEIVNWNLQTCDEVSQITHSVTETLIGNQIPTHSNLIKLTDSKRPTTSKYVTFNVMDSTKYNTKADGAKPGSVDEVQMTSVPSTTLPVYSKVAKKRQQMIVSRALSDQTTGSPVQQMIVSRALSDLTTGSPVQQMIVSRALSDQTTESPVKKMIASRALSDLTTGSPVQQKRTNQPSKKLPRLSYIPDKGAEFCIDRVSHLVDSKSWVYTEYFHTQPKTTRVRLKFAFNEEHRIRVRLCVSQCPPEVRCKWPVYFIGSGKILNKETKRYNPIWKFGLQECDRPDPEVEVELSATVSLQTTLTHLKNVRYGELVNLKYASDDQFKFLWTLTAH